MFFFRKVVCFHSFFYKNRDFFTFFGSFFGDSIHWVPSVVSVAGKWTWKVTGSNFELIWMVLKVLQRYFFQTILIKKHMFFYWKNSIFHHFSIISIHFWHFCCRTSTISTMDFHHSVVVALSDFFVQRIQNGRSVAPAGPGSGRVQVLEPIVN